MRQVQNCPTTFFSKGEMNEDAINSEIDIFVLIKLLFIIHCNIDIYIFR